MANGAYCSNAECEYNEQSCYCDYPGSITIDDNSYCITFRYKHKEED